MDELHNLEEDIKTTQQAEEQAMVTHIHTQTNTYMWFSLEQLQTLPEDIVWFIVIANTKVSYLMQVTTYNILNRLTKIKMTQASFHEDMEKLETSQTKQQVTLGH